MTTTSWMVIAVVFYIMMMIAMSYYVFFIRRSTVFDAVGQYIFFLSLFTLPLPIKLCFSWDIEGNISPYLLQFIDKVPISVFYSAMALPLFIVSYYSALAGRLAAWIPVPRLVSSQRLLSASAVLMVLAFILLSILAADSGGLKNLILLGYGSTSELFGKGYLAVGFPLLVVAVMFLFTQYAVERKPKDLLLVIVGWLLVAGIFVVMGNRSMLMYMAIVTAVFSHHGIKRLKPRVYVTAGIIGFMGLNMMGGIRGSQYDSIDDFWDRSSDSVTIVQDYGSETYFNTLTRGEFVVPFETLPQMVRTIGVSESPWFGVSYLRAPLYLIPSAIFPDRPLPLANWYMRKFYGGGYGLNEGRQFFFLGEAYLNFGPGGILLIPLLWGLLWGGVHQWVKLSRDNLPSVLIYALAVGFIFRAIAGDFSVLVAGFTQQSLAGALIGLFVAGVRWNRIRMVRQSV